VAYPYLLLVYSTGRAGGHSGPLDEWWGERERSLVSALDATRAAVLVFVYVLFFVFLVATLVYSKRNEVWNWIVLGVALVLCLSAWAPALIFM